ncbi:unnamed protein product [Leuciscus chuanchicus]
MDNEDEEQESTTVRYQPENLEQLQSQTHFSRQELQLLYRGFKNECPSGVVNEDTFKNIYAVFFPLGDSSKYAQFLFNAFDKDKNGSLSFEELVCDLSVLLRGTTEEKLNWAFNLYDINKDGLITKEEMLDILKSIYDLMGKSIHPRLKEEAVRQHVSIFFQVDLFASQESFHCPLWYSLTEAPLGTDALAHSWLRDRRKYAFPSVGLIAQTLSGRKRNKI